MADTLYLVDGSGYIFRAFYAVAPLTARDGLPTNALFGFTRMLIKLIREAKSKHIAVIFDAGKQTFRNEIYDGYKANRKDCPEELLPQFPYFRQIATALGLPILELAGFEADDLIGTIVSRLESNGTECIVVSGDKDLMQLVNDKVSVWDTMRDIKFTAKEVFDKFSVPPVQLAELLALCGDSSDNVPGVDGVGPKTAAQLVQKYETIENILSSIASIREDSTLRNRNKIAQQLESCAEQLRLSRRLVEIRRDVPISLALEGKTMNIAEMSGPEIVGGLTRFKPDIAESRRLFGRLEFGSLLKDVQAEIYGTPSETDGAQFGEASGVTGSGAIVTSIAEVERLFSEASRANELALHFFSNGESIEGASFFFSPGSSFYVPLGETGIALEEFLPLLKVIMEETAIAKVGYGLKEQSRLMLSHGICVKGIAFDCMVAAYLISPDKSSAGIGALLREHLQDEWPYDEIISDLGARASVPGRLMALRAALVSKLEALELTKVFTDIEIPLVSILCAMESKGVCIDADLLAVLSDEFAQSTERIQAQIFGEAGCEFNLNSPKQLSEILFTKMAIPTMGLKKTKTGISTDSSVLEKLALEHALPRLILDYRSLFKLKTTYVDVLPRLRSEATGRVHSTFHQTVTATGRLSSSDPNLQNIPIQTPEGRRIRAAFVAAGDRKLISADYSQIELRVLADLSGDERLIEAFIEDRDVHEETTREILGIPQGRAIDAAQRRIGKTINFGVIYGMSGFRLARELGIGVGEANRYIESYFERFAGVRSYFERLESQLKESGFVRTIFGRRRNIADIDTTGRDRGFMVRAALNAPIQGSAADLIKLAMIRLASRIEEERSPLELILQIHDELLFECSNDFVEEASATIRYEMENIWKLKVPLRVDIGVGVNWQAAHL